MVAMDENNKAVQVPGLELHSETEIRRFVHAFQRKQMKKHYRQEELLMKETHSIEEYVAVLKNERCRVGPEIRI
jgi:hypothetical protein